MENKTLKRLPVGIQTYSEIIDRGCLYIDKTEYICKMMEVSKYIFLSRPRRFGKSLLVSTLQAYFEGRKDLFKGLYIESVEKEWMEYPVLKFSMASGKHMEKEQLERYLLNILEENERRFGLSSDSKDPNVRLKKLIFNVHEKTGKKVVVLIDEYDAPLLDVAHEEETLPVLRNVMRNFYSPLKDSDPYLHFLFLTGITKFSQLSIFSELNNLKNISMMPEFAAICGISKTEVEDQMADYLDDFAAHNQLTRQEIMDALKRQYDGYHFTWPSSDIFNLLTVPYCDNANSEGHYQQMLYVIFSLFGRYVEVEVHTPRGRVDVVMMSSNTLYLFELKLNKDAATAIEQINLKDYASKFALCNLPIVKVGINFDSEQRTITDWEIVRK